MQILLVLSMVITAFAGELTQADLTKCDKDADCIVVPYKHCCGSSKRAIHKKHKQLYESKKEWQVFQDETCNLMGLCPSDAKINAAGCSSEKRCELKR